MHREQVTAALEASKLIAILRGDFRGAELEIAAALLDGGIRLMEVSAVSADYSNVIRRISDAFGGRMVIGAGTVFTLDQLEEAVTAGAAFIVSPNTNEAVISRTRELGCASFPGAFTPTEIEQALRSGADAVKLFPAGSLGPKFVRAVRGPMPHVKLIPTGGVHAGNALEWMSAGAWALAVGSELVNSQIIESRNWDLLAEKSRQLVRAVLPGAVQGLGAVQHSGPVHG